MAVAGAGALLLWLKSDLWPEPTPARLSYFEPHAGGCAWYRHEIGEGSDGDREALAVFPTDCTMVRVAFPPKLDHAIVDFEADPRGEEALDSLVFDVDLGKGKPERLPRPEPGDARAFAFDADGKLYAFTLDFEFEASERDGEPLTFNGKSLVRSTFPDGADALAHTLLWEAGSWHLVETVATRCCVERAPGVRALPTFTALAADPRLAWLRREARHVPPETMQKTRLEALPDFPFTAREPLEVSSFGPYLLVSEARTGARAAVYDRKGRTRVLFAPHSFGATFWPVDTPAYGR